MNAEQLANATAGTIEQRDINIRQTSNGFVLMGNRRFVEPDTLAARATLSVEAVADTSSLAATLAATFLNTGAF